MGVPMCWCFWYPKSAPIGDRYWMEAELVVFSRKEFRISRASIHPPLFCSSLSVHSFSHPQALINCKLPMSLWQVSPKPSPLFHHSSAYVPHCIMVSFYVHSIWVNKWILTTVVCCGMSGSGTVSILSLKPGSLPFIPCINQSQSVNYPRYLLEH